MFPPANLQASLRATLADDLLAFAPELILVAAILGVLLARMVPEKAVEIATQLTISTDISLKREHEEAARRSTAIPYGFIFSGLCLMALGLSVYLDTPVIISLALLGVTALTIGMTFVIVTGKVTPEGFVKMVTGLKQGKEGQTPKEIEAKEEETE